jgi:tetratricopeptide (TPR) repeat protein
VRFSNARVWPGIAFLLALAVLVAAVYGQARSLGFIYDDQEVILRQAPLRSLADAGRVFRERHFPGLPYYRPITRLTFLAQKTLHGDAATPFHLVNVALMVLAGWLAYALLRQPVWRLPAGLAFLAAAVFVVHPAASSCVYPVASGRETLLPAVLALAAMLAWLRDSGPWRGAALAFAAAAVFAKEQMVMLPFVFLAADSLGLAGGDRGRPRWQSLAAYAALTGLLVVYVFLRHQLFQASEWRTDLAAEPWLPAWSYLYGWQTSWLPFLDLRYEPPLALWFSWPRVIASGVILPLMAWAVWRVPDPVRHACLFWGLWWVLWQLPTANFLRQEARFDERYVFLAFLAVPAVMSLLTARAWPRPVFRRLAVVAVLAVLAVFALISQSRGRYFRDDLAFARQWARTNPGSVIARANIGSGLLAQGRPAEAIPYLEQALAMKPDLAEAWYNLGVCFGQLGRRADARSRYGRALDCDPGHVQARFNLAVTLAEDGNQAGAESAYRVVLDLAPGHVEASYNLGLLLAQTGATEEAAQHFQRVLALQPTHIRARYNLAVALERLSRFDEAREHYEQALRVSPAFHDARFNLGLLLARQGCVDEAAACLDAVLQAEPDALDAWLGLGRIYETVGRLGEAAAVYERGLRQIPGQPELERRRAALEGE